MKRVTGIGGVFFKSKDPAKTREWYGKHLGLAINDYGSVFEFRDSESKEKGYLQWSPFKEDSDYFAPSKREFMINYRVDNLEELKKALVEEGVEICDDIETYDYGKFLHIMDNDGNKIELWEPVDKVFGEMGDETTR